MEGLESALLDRARQGDTAAFGGLAQARWTGLVRLARSVVGDAEAEDAVQDALVLAWRRLGSLRQPSAFSSWLTRITVRECLRRTRRRRPWISLAAVPEPSVAENPGGDIDVERLLAALAPRQRAVMHLTVIDGMSDSEIAGLMHITAASVRSHRRRARARLKETLEGGRRS